MSSLIFFSKFTEMLYLHQNKCSEKSITILVAEIEVKNVVFANVVVSHIYCICPGRKYHKHFRFRPLNILPSLSVIFSRTTSSERQCLKWVGGRALALLVCLWLRLLLNAQRNNLYLWDTNVERRQTYRSLINNQRVSPNGCQFVKRNIEQIVNFWP